MTQDAPLQCYLSRRDSGMLRRQRHLRTEAKLRAPALLLPADPSPREGRGSDTGPLGQFSPPVYLQLWSLRLGYSLFKLYLDQVVRKNHPG